MSDELKVQIVKNEVKNFMTAVKMLLTVRAPIEGQRQYLTGELPESFHEVVASDEFTEIYSNAVKAMNEIIDNLVLYTDNIAGIFNMPFSETLPKTAEELSKMTQELYDEIKKGESK